MQALIGSAFFNGFGLAGLLLKTAIGFPFNGTKIAGEVVAKAFFDQPDGHANASLDCQLVDQRTTIRNTTDAPGPLKTSEISLQHVKAKQPLRAVFGQLEQDLS